MSELREVGSIYCERTYDGYKDTFNLVLVFGWLLIPKYLVRFPQSVCVALNIISVQVLLLLRKVTICLISWVPKCDRRRNINGLRCYVWRGWTHSWLCVKLWMRKLASWHFVGFKTIFQSAVTDVFLALMPFLVKWLITLSSHYKKLYLSNFNGVKALKVFF